MKIFLATDHAGFEFKEKMKAFLQEKGYEVEDCGAYSLEKDDDYPDFIAKAAEAVSKDPENTRGIVLGGSGQGEAMVANKFDNVRCALFYTKAVPTQSINAEGHTSEDAFEIIKLTRAHNFSNMLSLGVRFLTEADAFHAVEVWLNAELSPEQRHARRVEKIKQIEKQH